MKSGSPGGHLPVATLGAGLHLAVVLGVIAEERCLAVVEPDHAAIVRVVLAVVAEEFPAQDVSARGQRMSPQFECGTTTLLPTLTLAGRRCSAPPPAVYRRRSMFLWCSGRSSTDGPQQHLNTGSHQLFTCVWNPAHAAGNVDAHLTHTS